MVNEGLAESGAVEGPAAAWDCGGAAYDEVSYAIADAIMHTTKRLDAQAGERVLDVATGTGWAARNAARGGAQVVGVDIAPSLLAAAATCQRTSARPFASSAPMRRPFPLPTQRSTRSSRHSG